MLKEIARAVPANACPPPRHAHPGGGRRYPHEPYIRIAGIIRRRKVKDLLN